MILEATQVTKIFGGLTAVNRLDISVDRGEIVGLIGPNGAGKTTFFNCVAGHLHPESGSIRFEGREVSRERADRICRQGIARTFQAARTFGDLSVLDNVMVGAFAHTRRRPIASQSAREWLEFVGLGDRAEDPARDLTIGARKKLEVARALATRPSLLLLDEVMAGLNATEVYQMLDLLREINRRGITLIVIEHIMAAIMEISARVVVIHHGEKIAEGPPRDVTRDPVVIEAYLGEEDSYA